MIYAKNNQEIGVAYGRPYLLSRNRQAEKLRVRVKAGDEKSPYGSVIVQVTEDPEQFFDNDSETEILLDLGHHSIGFAVGVTGWRFRTDGALPGLIDFVGYGY